MDQTHTQAWFHVGVITFQGGDLDQAINAFRKAIELCPDFAEAHNNLGNALGVRESSTPLANATQVRSLIRRGTVMR